MRLRSVLKFFGWVVGIGVLLFVVGFFSYRIGVYDGEQNILTTPPVYLVNQEPEGPRQVDMAVFWEVWRQVERKFLDKENIDYQKMVYGAVGGMIETLDDPYTTFFNPKETEDFEEELSGKYEGVGMYVGIKEEQLTVISPLKSSPAEQAGLEAGDKILQIDDVYTLDITIEEAVSLIKGPRGTEVRLLIQRDSFKESKEFKVRRELIKIPTLEWELLEQDIALIKIYQFNQLLTGEFSKAALEILNSNTEKIIVDLRNNPGGYLEVAQAIAGWFLEKDQVVVWQDIGEEGNEAYKSKGPSTFVKYPVVVLINQGSASGAEILAGALRDQRGVQLIGEKSFGKGSVQEQLGLSDGSSLKVTIAKWLTPNGKNIDEEGLEPDIEVAVEEVENDDDEQDIQLEKAIEILKSLR